MAGNVIQVTPFMHVRDLEEALGFWCGLLGFRVVVRMSDYAYVEREGSGVRILAYEGAHRFEGGRDRFAYYVDVRDVDSLYAELRPKLDSLAPEDVHGPADTEYGQRELLIRAPDGQLAVLGQAIATANRV